MAAEDQIVNFLLGLEVGKHFDRGVRKAKAGLSKVEEAADAAFSAAEKARDEGKSFGMLNLEKFPRVAKAAAATSTFLKGSLVGLFAVVAKQGADWFRFHLDMDRYRRSAGLSRQETSEFGAEIIRQTSSYGVALRKVQMISTFMARGAKGVTKEVAALAGQLANLADGSNVNEKSMAELGTQLTRYAKITGDDVVKNVFALQQTSKATGIPVQEMTDLINNQAQHLRAYGRENAPKFLKQMTALGSAFYTVGGPIEGVKAFNSLMEQLSDPTSQMGIILATEGLAGLQRHFGDLTKQMDMYSDVQFSESFGIDKNVVKVWRDIRGEIGQAASVFEREVQTPIEDIERRVEDALGPWKRFGRAFNKIGGGIKESFQEFFGEGSFWYDGLEELSKWFDKTFGTLAKKIKFFAETMDEMFRSVFLPTKAEEFRGVELTESEKLASQFGRSMIHLYENAVKPGKMSMEEFMAVRSRRMASLGLDQPGSVTGAYARASGFEQPKPPDFTGRIKRFEASISPGIPEAVKAGPMGGQEGLTRATQASAKELSEQTRLLQRIDKKLGSGSPGPGNTPSPGIGTGAAAAVEGGR